MASVSPLDDKVNSAATANISNSEKEAHNRELKERRASTFVTEGLAKEHYRPVNSYEGIHRYDPDFEWEPAEEKRILRKVDIELMTLDSKESY